ncbi:DUF1003 domain-containing protein [Nostoc sp. FACHB-87]|uniref:DUF1003 domain-containing protein n=2 Tax=Cyanophyceae TaxID=3028117 RepID=UPI001686E974|nr:MULTISPECIES: DUF1003 domain-containing protein [Nostocales]MBD2300378.1 DUF1003 domain-containing protein [Nostoc sp. FACHB-190]MBD2457874.1 DUF1003 domain-containing protein [Nostoc sp. FACHB-87]MBD2474590.1 DUF1003 domain-containing protein [Anabaena sp. FACHB-83]MBD2487937.1 DUF1003 domain-containing protein [Aulosira sp. FACHB-615]
MKPVVNQKLATQQITTEELTPGQRLADKLASHVGSWKFLICQSTVLAGWVGLNLAPGVPHWDESPFILLNLVFSFASAYTAPIVLMSQNRQSDTDRRNADIDHQVNLRAGQNIELLHEKLDKLHTQQIAELTEIVKEQQQMLREMKVHLSVSKEVKDNRVTLAPGLVVQINEKFPKTAPFTPVSKQDKFVDDHTKVIDQYIRR